MRHVHCDDHEPLSAATAVITQAVTQLQLATHRSGAARPVIINIIKAERGSIDQGNRYEKAELG